MSGCCAPAYLLADLHIEVSQESHVPVRTTPLVRTKGKRVATPLDVMALGTLCSGSSAP
jgi:hypothetical protein